MTKLTISLPEETLEALCKQAKAEGKSLNALVADLLSREVRADTALVDEILRLSDLAAESTVNAGAVDRKWDRMEIYEGRRQ